MRDTERWDKNGGWDTVIRPKRGWLDVDIAGVPRYRDLILLLVRREFTLVYRQTVLGPLWILLHPLLTTLIFTVVFGNIAGLPTDGLPKFLFYMSGNILWQFFANCISTTSHTFTSNRKLFGKVYFPRLCVPVADVLSEMINFFIQFLLFIAFVLYYVIRGTNSVSPNGSLILFTPLVLIQMALLGMGIGLIIAALTTRYRDLVMLVRFGLRLWMYLSPVTYAASMVAEKFPGMYSLYMLNPAAPALAVFRGAYLGSGGIEPVYCVISAIITLAVFAAGVILFSHSEKNFMDTI